MLTEVEGSTPVISFFSIPEGTHNETYALQGRSSEGELEPSVAMSARPVPLLTGDGALLMLLYACRCPLEKRWCHST